MVASFDLWTVLPTLVPALYGLLLLLFVPMLRHDHRWLWGSALGGMLVTTLVPATMLMRIADYGNVRETAGVPGLAMVRTDPLALWLDLIFGIAGLLALLVTPGYLERARGQRAEVYPLMFLALAGMTIMVGTDNLVMIFLGLEVLSISLYVMCGLTREQGTALEAALKYFLLGAFSSGFLVYGIALILGATGKLDLPRIAAAAAAVDTLDPYGGLMLFAGLALVIVAFAFKVAAVPFHFWAPDVYTGAPTPVTAFMAAGTKAAAFGVLLRVLHTGFDGSPEFVARWGAVIAVLAAATMIIGNVLALVQTRVKRLLAYSSISHAGYLLLALLAPLPIGAANLVFYLLAYTFMTVGAFAVVALFQDEGEDADQIANFAGLWQRRPYVAVAMGVFLLSLTGIPPTGGFTGKYVIFMAAIQSGHPVLAAVMGVAAVIGAAYYLRVIVAMFLEDPAGQLSAGLRVPAASGVALGIAVLGTVVLGVYPSLVLEPLARIADGFGLP